MINSINNNDFGWFFILASLLQLAGSGGMLSSVFFDSCFILFVSFSLTASSFVEEEQELVYFFIQTLLLLSTFTQIRLKIQAKSSMMPVV
jgi:hypothetical protein